MGEGLENPYCQDFFIFTHDANKTNASKYIHVEHAFLYMVYIRIIT